MSAINSMPGQGSLDSDIRAGDEKIANLFLPCIYDRRDRVNAWEFNKLSDDSKILDGKLFFITMCFD
jgi:hypothetical protein